MGFNGLGVQVQTSRFRKEGSEICVRDSSVGKSQAQNPRCRKAVTVLEIQALTSHPPPHPALWGQSTRSPDAVPVARAVPR